MLRGDTIMNPLLRALSRFQSVFLAVVIISFTHLSGNAQEFGPPLPGTKPLTMTGDIASDLVAGVDRFLLKQIDESERKREQYWKRDFSSLKAYDASVESNRKHLAHILGIRDHLAQAEMIDYPDDFSYLMAVGSREAYGVRSVRWPAFGDVNGEGLEATMPTRMPMDTIIVIPDADQTPEQLFGLMPGVPAGSQVARRLAENGYNVIVPSLIDRTVAPRNGRAKLTNREFVYRSAFELGRHIIGYEVQKVLALVELATRRRPPGSNTKIGIFGYGEGGAIALYTAALETRVAAVGVSGYFDDRTDLWRQPVDRNVFGLLEQFGDAEVASLIAPRPLIVEAASSPEFVIPPGTGGAPGRLTTPRLATVMAEVDRARCARRRPEKRRHDRTGEERPRWNRAFRIRSSDSTSFRIDDARCEIATAQGPSRAAWHQPGRRHQGTKSFGSDGSYEFATAQGPS